MQKNGISLSDLQYILKYMYYKCKRMGSSLSELNLNKPHWKKKS